jgi:hypothetical protein
LYNIVVLAACTTRSVILEEITLNDDIGASGTVENIVLCGRVSRKVAVVILDIYSIDNLILEEIGTMRYIRHRVILDGNVACST